jgi:two-component system, cell cycle sensor histidine kinase and response regulator CckA
MPPAPRHVLIADDERDIATLLARILTPLGLTPIVIYNGSDAITSAQSHAHELCLAILDVQMPGTNGVDAAITIYQLAPHVPIVLMSGGIPQNLATRIAQIPLAGMLTKPFTIQEVHTLLIQLGLISPRP